MNILESWKQYESSEDTLPRI